MNEYEMTEQELQEIINASKPVPYMVFGGIKPSSPRENAMIAWKALGKKRGFDYMTVKPSSKGNRFFTAKEEGIE